MRYMYTKTKRRLSKMFLTISNSFIRPNAILISDRPIAGFHELNLFRLIESDVDVRQAR